MDFAFPLVAVAQQQHLALAQQLGHGKREAQQEWNTHQAPASTSKRARTHAVEAAAATTGQQEALCVAHRGDCPGAPGAGSQAQPSYFPGTSIPLGGWILPCRSCRMYTGSSVDLPNGESVPVCKRCQAKLGHIVSGQMLASAGQHRRSSSGVSCSSSVSAASSLAAPSSAQSSPMSLVQPPAGQGEPSFR